MQLPDACKDLYNAVVCKQNMFAAAYKRYELPAAGKENMFSGLYKRQVFPDPFKQTQFAFVKNNYVFPPTRNQKEFAAASCCRWQQHVFAGAFKQHEFASVLHDNSTTVLLPIVYSMSLWANNINLLVHDVEQMFFAVCE
jgi:hypothetical protein